MDVASLTTCKTCGSVVGERTLHERWHSRVSAVETTAAAAMEAAEDAQDAAETAQSTADDAANVLYQNNIQV